MLVKEAKETYPKNWEEYLFREILTSLTDITLPKPIGMVFGKLYGEGIFTFSRHTMYHTNEN